MPATIADNALTAAADSAAEDPYSGDPQGASVEFRLDGGPYFTNDGVIVSPAEVAVDPVTGFFTVELVSTDLDVENGNPQYRARFKRWGSVLATTEAFDLLDGYNGRLLGLVDLSNVEEGQLSGRQIGFQRITGADLTTTAAGWVDIPGVSCDFLVGGRPISIEFYATFLTMNAAGRVLIQMTVDGVAVADQWFNTGPEIYGNVFVEGHSQVDIRHPYNTGELAEGFHTVQMKWAVFANTLTLKPDGTGVFPGRTYLRVDEH